MKNLEIALKNLKIAYRNQLNCETIEEIENGFDLLVVACISYAEEKLLILKEETINDNVSDLICARDFDDFLSQLEDLITNGTPKLEIEKRKAQTPSWWLDLYTDANGDCFSDSEF